MEELTLEEVEVFKVGVAPPRPSLVSAADRRLPGQGREGVPGVQN